MADGRCLARKTCAGIPGIDAQQRTPGTPVPDLKAHGMSEPGTRLDPKPPPAYSANEQTPTTWRLLVTCCRVE